MHPTPAQPFDGTHDREIETLAEFDEVVSARGTLAHFRVQAVDLTDRTDVLMSVGSEGAVFLGCPMDPEAAAKVRAAGALVFPPVPGLPFDPYRGLLYTPDELFEYLDQGYETTPDALAYTWFRRTRADGDVFGSMLRALHDDSVSDALDELLVGARVVGVMGGHAMARGTEAYAGAARLGRELARAGFTVATCLRRAHRQVLRQRRPRGRTAGPLQRGCGLPAGRRRHRAGGLRQRDAELLRVAR